MMPTRYWTVNGRFLSQPQTGVQRYAREIVRSMDAHLADSGRHGSLNIELVCPRGAQSLDGLKCIRQVEVGHGAGHAWEQLILPRYVKGGLLSLGNTGPLRVSNQILCIHDANTILYPKSYSRGFRLFYRTIVPWLGKRVQAVTTVSRFSADQISKFRMAPAYKITVAPNGHEHITAHAAEHSAITREAAGSKTIVVVGSPAPHKNIALILRLAPRLAGLGFKIAIAGSLDSRVFSTAAANPDRHRTVIWLGRVSDAEMVALLRDSLCLAFPSYTEGFGLPALEAMTLGCPVVASDRASIPEVCGDAALYASPDNDDLWISNFMRLDQDPQLRSRLADLGRAQAKKFSWQGSARMYLDLIGPMSRLAA